MTSYKTSETSPEAIGDKKIWDLADDLSSKLSTKKTESAKLIRQQFTKKVDDLRNHLNEVDNIFDWKKIANSEISSDFLDSIKKPRLDFIYIHWIAFFIVTTVAAGSISGSANIGTIIGMIASIFSYRWVNVKKENILRKNTKLRIMHFSHNVEGSQYPDVYNALLVDTNLIQPGVVIQEYSYSAIDRGNKNTVIGIFDLNGQPIGAGVVYLGEIVVYAFGRRDTLFKKDILNKDISILIDRENSIIFELDKVESDLIRTQTKFNVSNAKEAWKNIVLPPTILESVLRAWVLFAQQDRSAPKGILFKGPPGTGKTMIASVFAESCGANFIKLSVSDLKGEHIGSSGINVKKIWEEARSAQPSVIFVDECEGVFVKRGSDQGDSFTNEMIQTFLTEWDGIGNSENILVIGATNRADLLDDAVISRFTDVIQLNPIESHGRSELVSAIGSQIGISVNLSKSVISQMSGMSGRDIRNIFQQAQRLASPEIANEHHFIKVIEKTRGKTSIATDSNANWDSLVLDEKTKQHLKTTCLMVKESESLLAKGIPVAKTLLLYGPPGTGKTQIAKTIANEAHLTFISKTTSDIKGQYLGHAASRVSQIFETARSASPSILFIDEIDSIASARTSGTDDALKNEALTQLLQEIDGVVSQPGFVFVIAATNQIDDLDSAIISRFGNKIEIGLPNDNQIAQLITIILKNRPISEDFDINEVASKLTGKSGREIKEIISRAFNCAVQRTILEEKDIASTILTTQDIYSISSAAA